MQTGNHEQLTVVSAIKCMKAKLIEDAMHHIFNDYRINDNLEWFDAPKESMLAVSKFLVTILDGLNAVDHDEFSIAAHLNEISASFRDRILHLPEHPAHVDVETSSVIDEPEDRYIYDCSYECPGKVLASSRILMEENDPFAHFVKLAIRKSKERTAYFTVKEARRVWKELAKGPDNEMLRSIPKESDLSSNLSRLLRLKCIPQTWITCENGSKRNARSVFRNVSLQYEFENGILVSRPTE